MATVAGKMGGSKPGAADVSPSRKEPDTKLYSGRVAARIRLLREKAGLTVEQVTARMQERGYQISAPTFYHWENGQRQPQLDALPDLAAVLKVKIADLLPPK